MNRNTRTLIVIVVALATASAATFLVARAIQNRPVETREVAHTFVVAAARPLQVGAMVSPADLKLVPWPDRAVVPGSFTKIEDAVNRGVVMPVSENEPVTNTKLA